MNIWKSLEKNNLFKTGVKYSGVSTVHSFAGMIIGILIMRWLTPSELGLWNAVSIFQAYIPFFHFGIQSALNLELPILLGKDKKTYAESLVASAKGFSLFVTYLFLIAGTLLSVILYSIGKDISFVLGVFTVGIIAASSSQQLHLIATYRSSKSFDKLTKILVINTFLLFFLAWFIYKYHYYGILIYNGMKFSIYAILLNYFAPYKKLKPDFNISNLKILAKNGLVLMSFVQIRAFAQSIPKWILLSLGGVINLGLYSPALAINGLMNMLPLQLSQFIQPQMGFKYGQTGKARDVWKYLKKMIIFFPLVSLPIAITIFLLSPWLLSSYFPKYIESVNAMRIMAFGFVFSSAFNSHGFLYTIKAYKNAYIYSGVELLGYFLWPFSFSKFSNFDILTSIALGVAVNNFLLYFLNIVLIRSAIFHEKYNQ